MLLAVKSDRSGFDLIEITLLVFALDDLHTSDQNKNEEPDPSKKNAD